jgi:hypothetical protein
MRLLILILAYTLITAHTAATTYLTLDWLCH